MKRTIIFMGKRAPELSFERVIDELRTPRLLQGSRPERAYLVLEKHEQQLYLDTYSQDIEQKLEHLMSYAWVPLGFVAFYTDGAKPVTSALNWYADLLTRNERRYSELYRIVSARLEEAAKRLTKELLESRLVPRVQ